MDVSLEKRTETIQERKMRLLVESLKGGDVRIFKDRSLFGIPRWVVDDGRSIKIFNKLWYSLDDVKKAVDLKDNLEDNGS